jgi:hypothetical protein
VEVIRRNRYEFISDQARDARAKYGVKSVSVSRSRLAKRPGRRPVNDTYAALDRVYTHAKA